MDDVPNLMTIVFEVDEKVWLVAMLFVSPKIQLGIRWKRRTQGLEIRVTNQEEKAVKD